jgi:LytS/YehU family sensor histidine kinase
LAEFALLSLSWEDSLADLALLIFPAAIAAALAFELFEHWPGLLPSWAARWVLQLLAMEFAILATVGTLFVATTSPGALPFWESRERLVSFVAISLFGMLQGQLIGMAALLRRRDAHVRQAERQRNELERQAVDARAWLLRAQVQPHFLFNTLASLQTLVDTHSPQAPMVLEHLVTYLRAAVPRLHEPVTRFGDELDMVRAYLILMQMRMPDRLQFTIDAGIGCAHLQCPPLTLMTLVENSIRHGIDPSLAGGQIDVSIATTEGRCHIRVRDTGVGLQARSPGLGSGLSSLRERLALTFAGDAVLRISEQAPHGFCVDIECPAWS